MRWTIRMQIYDGIPSTDFCWEGEASSRAEAIQKARLAYKGGDEAASFQVTSVSTNHQPAGA